MKKKIKIHKEGQYTNMITIREMTDNEKNEYVAEREKYNMLVNGEAIGTTIKFKYNDTLNNLIKNNFKPVSTSEDDDGKFNTCMLAIDNEVNNGEHRSEPGI